MATDSTMPLAGVERHWRRDDRAAGRTFDDVVKVNVYLIDMRDFAAMNDIYSTIFAAPYPARTTVAVAGLPVGARVEIELVA